MNRTTRRNMTAGALALCCALTLKAEIEVPWSTTDTGTSYADGAVAVTRDTANKVIKLTVDPAAAEGLRFTGETIDFSDDGGEVAVVSDGGLVFETAMVSSGMLKFSTTVEVFKDFDLGSSFRSGTILTDASTEDWDVWFSRYEEGTKMCGYVRPYFSSRMGTTLYADLQSCTKSATKGIVAVLEQKGSDVSLRYYGNVGNVYSANIRGCDQTKQASASQDWNFYPTHMRLIRRKGFVTISLRSAVSAAALDVGGGLAVYADGDAALVGSGGTFAVPVRIIDGHFGFRGRTAPATLKMPVTGQNCELDFIASEAEQGAEEGTAQTIFTFASGENVTTNCTVNIVGSPAREQVVQITGKGILPGLAREGLLIGRVEIGNRGRLILKVTGVTNRRGNNANTEINVNAGGILESARYWQLDCRQTVYLYGGTFLYNVTSNDPEYLGNFLFRDGAQVKCDCAYYGFTMGYAEGFDVGWNVSSVKGLPSVCNANVTFLGDGYGTAVRTYDFTVADVTDDEQEDFVVNGKMTEKAAVGYERIRLEKRGSGTMRVNGKCAVYYEPIKIQDGTWMLGDSDVFDSNVNVLLQGGCLAAAAGTTNSVGLISLTTDSTMAVADGASVSFADCSSQTWTGSLNVMADLRKSSIRFGTSEASLTAEQKSRIRVNGHKAYVDSEGYLVPGGLVLLVR